MSCNTQAPQWWRRSTRRMLPGVELARKRRVHCHHDMHVHRGVLPDPKCGRLVPFDPSDSDMSERVLLARMRLEEKLRRFSGPNTSSSRSVNGAAARSQSQPQAQQRSVMGETSPRRSVLFQRRDSRVDVCAVCLEDVQAQQSITSLPCSHKYHSNCLLPWLAAHSHCPYCRTPVPQLPTFS